MSNTEPARVSVRIIEKEFFVACPLRGTSALLDAAEFLNAGCARSATPARSWDWTGIAVMVALNLANDLLRIREEQTQVASSTVTRVRAARERPRQRWSATSSWSCSSFPTRARLHPSSC